MNRHLIAVMLVVAICGCTSKSAQMLDDRRMSISYLGNTHMSVTDVTREILHTSATEGRERGFAYFQVTQATDATRTAMAALPTTTNTFGTVNASCRSGYCSGTGTAASTSYSGGVVGIVRPGADVQVSFYRDGEIDPATPGLWGVASVLAND